MDKAINQGKDIIRIKGTNKSIWRNVYLQGDGKYLIKYYGQNIEVKKIAIGFITVDYIDC